MIGVARQALPGVNPIASPARVPGRDVAEREADSAADRVMERSPLGGWSFSSVSIGPPADLGGPLDRWATAAVEGPGHPIDQPTRRELEARFQMDLRPVRIHDDARSAAATTAAGATALTLGEDVALASDPGPTASSERRRALAHEIAHVAQQRVSGSAPLVQRQGTAPAVSTMTLSGLPEADRKDIQVVTAKVNVGGLAAKFATKAPMTTLSLPSGVTTALDASVDPALKHGIDNVAAALSTTIEVTPAPLPRNSTVAIELNLPATILQGLYRFTYYAPKAPPGSKTPAPAPRILVEALGKAGPPAGMKALPAPSGAAPAAPDPIAEKISRHSIVQSYTGLELDALRAAIDQAPDSHLAVVSGIRFRRDTADKKDPLVAGHYDSKTHAITMYDWAFSRSQVRSKASGATASSEATRAILHELGHAIDLAPLRTADIAKTKADAAVALLPQQYPDPKDPKGYQWTNEAEKKAIKAILGAQTAAEAGLLAARAMSGTRTVRQPTGDFKDVIGTDVKGTKFREAAAKDGGKAVTAYGDTDFQEAFSEAYSLYITSPDTIKALRPHVYDYFVKGLPK
jgi:hypothetical protein